MKRFVVILPALVIVGCSTATDHAIRDRLAVFVDTPISFHGEVMQEYRRLDYIAMFVRPLTSCEIARKQDAKILASLEVVPYLKHEKRKLSPSRLKEKFLEWWKNSGGDEHAHRLQRFETGGSSIPSFWASDQAECFTIYPLSNEHLREFFHQRA